MPPCSFSTLDSRAARSYLAEKRITRKIMRKRSGKMRQKRSKKGVIEKLKKVLLLNIKYREETRGGCYLYRALLFTGVTWKGVTGEMMELARIHTCLLAITRLSKRQSSPVCGEGRVVVA